MCAFGMPMKALGLCLGEARFQVLHPEPRVDQDRHRPDLEEGEGEGEELRSGRDHEHRAHPPADAEADESVGDPVGEGVQFAEGEAAVLPGENDGRGVGMAAGHFREMGGDVDEVGWSGCDHGCVSGYYCSGHGFAPGSFLPVRSRKLVMRGITSAAASSRM